MGNANCSEPVSCTNVPLCGPDDEIHSHRQLEYSAGSAFDDTVKNLPYFDRQLLLFSGTGNLTAIRWLVHLGASKNTKDLNASSCLHVACRSGTIEIVKELVQIGCNVNSTDNFSWTPLHIACFMGREDVACYLTSTGKCKLALRNNQGQTASQMVSHPEMRVNIFPNEGHVNIKNVGDPFLGKSPTNKKLNSPSRSRFEKELRNEQNKAAPGDDMIAFYVPRKAVIPGIDRPIRRDQLLELALLFLEDNAGRGLAYAVASGACDDDPEAILKAIFPVDHSSDNFNLFSLDKDLDRSDEIRLKQKKAHNERIRKAASEFLGEDTSLSNVLRCAFTSSMDLVGSGIVEMLAFVFRRLRVPSDLRKLDRLTEAIARVWWVQHELLGNNNNNNINSTKKVSKSDWHGMHLHDALGSVMVLRQLVFSCILLHWSLHYSNQKIQFSEFLELNCTIGGKRIPDALLRLLYNDLKSKEITGLKPCTCVHKDAFPFSDQWVRKFGGIISHRRKNRRAMPSAPHGSIANDDPLPGFGEDSTDSTVDDDDCASVSAGMPCTDDLDQETISGWGTTARAQGFVNLEKVIAPIDAVWQQTPGLEQDSFVNAISVGSGQNPDPNVFSHNRKDEKRTWMSLQADSIFFADSSPSHGCGSPYAFIPLSSCMVVLNGQTKSIVLESRYDLPLGLPPVYVHPTEPPKQTTKLNSRFPVTVCVLYPDGTWQTRELNRLELRLCNENQYGAWQDALMASGVISC